MTGENELDELRVFFVNDLIILLMMHVFGHPILIRNWPRNVSVTTIMHNGRALYMITNPAAFGRGMGIVSPPSSSQGNFKRSRLVELLSK